jgi:hypothetical protein
MLLERDQRELPVTGRVRLRLVELLEDQARISGAVGVIP